MSTNSKQEPTNRPDMVTMSLEDLNKLIDDRVAERANNTSQGLSGDSLLEAIKEMRKPYLDPAAEAQKKADREMLRREQENKQKERTAQQDACSHRRPNGSSIVMGAWQSDGKLRMLCGSCLKTVEPGDPAYDQFVSMTNLDNCGSARSW